MVKNNTVRILHDSANLAVQGKRTLLLHNIEIKCLLYIKNYKKLLELPKTNNRHCKFYVSSSRTSDDTRFINNDSLNREVPLR